MRQARQVVAFGVASVAMLGGSLPAIAASPAETAAERRAMIESMLTREPVASIEKERRICAAGNAPASTAEARARGAYFHPDAADSCVAALIRLARENLLPGFYGELWTRTGGGGEGAAAFPRMIGAAALQGRTSVAIGQGRAAIATPALAFDAGFTVAYAERKVLPSANPAQLKAIAEGCLAQQQDVGTCFSAGYAYGAKAASGWTVTAAGPGL